MLVGQGCRWQVSWCRVIDDLAESDTGVGVEGYLIEQHISSHQHGVRQQACADILPLQHTRARCPGDQCV